MSSRCDQLLEEGGRSQALIVHHHRSTVGQISTNQFQMYNGLYFSIEMGCRPVAALVARYLLICHFINWATAFHWQLSAQARACPGLTSDFKF